MSNLQIRIELAEHQFRQEVRVDENGVGYASIRGVARLADISAGGLVDNLQKGVQLAPTGLAEFLINQGFEGVQLISCSTTGVPDQMLAAIIEYYAFEAGRYQTEQAKLVYRAFARMGVRAWMQTLTGWKEDTEAGKLSIEKFILEQMPAAPKPWECRFTSPFWTALEELYGLKRGQRACGKFISHWVYGYFPKEVRARIDEINPRLSDGYRDHLIHPHFDKTLEKALKIQIETVTSNLIKAKSRQHFKRLMKAVRRYRFTTDNLLAMSQRDKLAGR